MDQRWTGGENLPAMADDELPSLEELPAAIPLGPAQSIPLVEPALPAAIPVDSAPPRPFPFLLVALGGTGVLACGIVAIIGALWLTAGSRERPEQAANIAPLPPPPPPSAPAPGHEIPSPASNTESVAALPGSAPAADLPQTPAVAVASTPAVEPEPAVQPAIGAPAPNAPAIEAVASKTVTSSTATSSPSVEEPAAIPAAAPAATESPAELDLAQLLSAAGTPPPLPACNTPAEREEYVQHVAALLETGLGTIRDRTKEKASFEKAKALCATDPRLYYAYALVLHKAEADAAIAQLTLARRDGAHDYPPAWRLHVHLLARKGLSEGAIQGLVTLARRLEQTPGNWPDEAGKLEFAAFLGQTIAYLQGPAAEAKRFPTEIALADEQLLSVFQGGRLQAYQLAKAEAAAAAGELTESAELAADQQKAAATDQVQAAARENEGKTQALDDESQKLTRTKEEYDKKWEEAKVQFEKDFTRLKAQFDLLARNAQGVRMEIGRVEGRIAAIKNQIAMVEQMAASKRQSANGTQVFGLMQQVDGLSQERNLLRAQVMGIERQGGDVNVQAQIRVREMARLEAQYQKATGQLVKESDLISGKRDLLEAQAKAEAKKSIRKATASAARPELKRLTTYAPLDIDAEKRRILESYR